MKIPYIAQFEYYQKQICLMLVFVCVALFASYIYLISASIVHVVIRTESSQELKKVDSEIALLESRYIEAQNKVSSEIASLDGYTEIAKKVFIDRSVASFAMANSQAQ